jgi:hypothetical protein
MLYLKRIHRSDAETQASQEIAFEIWAPRFGNIKEFLSDSSESVSFAATPMGELEAAIQNARTSATSRLFFRDLTSAEPELLPELVALLCGMSSRSRELRLSFSVELRSDKLARILASSSVIAARMHEEFFEESGKLGEHRILLTARFSAGTRDPRWRTDHVVFLPEGLPAGAWEQIREFFRSGLENGETALFICSGDRIFSEANGDPRALTNCRYLRLDELINPTRARSPLREEPDRCVACAQFLVSSKGSVKNIYVPDFGGIGVRLIQAAETGYFSEAKVHLLCVGTLLTESLQGRSRITLKTLDLLTQEAICIERAESKVWIDPSIKQKYAQLGYAIAARPSPTRRPSSRLILPSFTVFIPFYNTPIDFFGPLICALNSQMLRPTNVLIIDDGSYLENFDNMQRIIEHDLKIPFRILRQENRGVSGVRNRALEEIKTPLFINLDSDNIPLPDFCLRLVTGLARVPDAVACVPYYLGTEFDSEGREIFQFHYPPLGDGRLLGLSKNCFGDNNAAYRTSELRAAGGWDATDKSRMEDYALFMNLISSGKKLVVVPKTLLLYRLHDHSVTRILPILPAEMKLIRNARFTDPLTALSIRQLLRGVREELSELRLARRRTLVGLAAMFLELSAGMKKRLRGRSIRQWFRKVRDTRLNRRWR